MSNVTTLRPTLPVTSRVAAIMEGLDDAIRAAQDVADEHPLELLCWMMQMSKSCTELVLLEKQMQMKKGTAELAGQFGRSP